MVFADFGPAPGSEVGARNGQERVECGPERVETLTGVVRRLPQESPTTRGNRRDQTRKNPNRERLGFRYWWPKGNMSIRPEACIFVRKDAGFCEPVMTHAGAGNAAKPVAEAAQVAASCVAIHGHFSSKEPHSPFSESGRVPPPTDAKNQPLDSSARNLLICIAMKWGLCGLRPLRRTEFGARNCPERVKKGVFWRREPRDEVRRNPHEPA